MARPAARRAFELAFFLGLVYAVNAWHSRDVPRGQLPPLALADLDGKPFRSASLHGKPTMLVVWAPWCGVCRLESQNVSWVQRLVGARAQVLSIAVGYRDGSQVQAFVSAQEVDYPVLLGGRDGADALGVHAFPTTLFLDAHGHIETAAVGYTTTLGLLLRLLP
jgi:thiol-disulfide isomerase/thioredoxin